jgi:Rrf2 family protein
MKISKKCQYALKAVFELAWRDQNEPLGTQKIAEAQRISPRFMEIILNELKHGGFVESRRGNEGGYMLARDARDLTVREIIEYIEGPILLVQNEDDTASVGNEAFAELWQEVNNAVGKVCESKTFANLVELERVKRDKCALNYSI